MPRALPPVEALDLVPLADIARGGMGSVQLCRVSSGRLGGRVLAVKRLNPELESDPQFVNMFIDETWMTAAIASPNVIRVEAWGQDALGHYLAVELVQGVSLSRLVKESRAKKEPFSERTAACILSQICAGLEAAHTLKDDTGALMNLVHRDLTPGNILVGFDGMVKLADFGIAKANARLTETTAGTMKGKPSYMAPEQARGTSVDSRADLFSLGVMAYELLGGQRPWVGANDLEVLIAVSSNEPVDLSQLRQVDPMFLEITRGCLQKDPDRRFSTASEIQRRLTNWRRSRGFEQGDLESLGEFVRRNTEKQLDWFSRALAGSQRDGATFKDVEEQIDKARKPSASQGRRMPSPQGGATAQPVVSTAPPPTAPGSNPGNRFPTAPSPGMSAGMTIPISAHLRPPGQLPPATRPPKPEVDDLAATRYVVPKSQPFDDLAATRIVDDLAATRMLSSPSSGQPSGHIESPTSPHVSPSPFSGTVAFSPEEMAARMQRPPPSQPNAPASTRGNTNRSVAGLTPPPPRAQPIGTWPQAGQSAQPQPPAPQSAASSPSPRHLPPSVTPHFAGSPQSARFPPGSYAPVPGYPGGAFSPQSGSQIAPTSSETSSPQSSPTSSPQSSPQSSPTSPRPTPPSPNRPLGGGAHGLEPKSAAGEAVVRKRSSGVIMGIMLLLVVVVSAVSAYFMRAKLGLR